MLDGFLVSFLGLGSTVGFLVSFCVNWGLVVDFSIVLFLIISSTVWPLTETKSLDLKSPPFNLTINEDVKSRGFSASRTFL